MCGIAGLLDARSGLSEEALGGATARSMVDSLRHRGPDADGIWDRVFALAPMGRPVHRAGEKMLRSAEFDRSAKMGFAVPIHSWLRGPPREWAEELLDERRLNEQGIYDAGPIRGLWAEHLAGRSYGEHMRWDILMFQNWHDRWRWTRPSISAGG